MKSLVALFSSRECEDARPLLARQVLGKAASLAVLATALLATTSFAQAVEITVWSGYPEMEAFYRHVADGMKAAHPDLTVRVEAITLREHEKRVALALASKSGADVVELAQSTATRYLDADLLQPAPKKVSDFVKTAANYDPFFQASATYGGKVYGIPIFRGQGALFYNTDMFAKAGLSAPKTTADYDDVAAKLVQRNAQNVPTVSGWSMRLSGGGQGIAEKFWINMFQFGGNVMEKNANDKWKVTLASPAGHATLKQYLHNLYDTKTVTIEMPADADAFERGQTAMFIRESWVIGDIASKAPKLPYATAPLPKGSIVNTNNLYVTSTGQKGDAAWDFAAATNDPQNLVWMLDNVGWLPNRSGLDYSAVVKKTPAFAAFVNYPQGYGFFTLPTIGPADEILTRLAARLTDAFAKPALANDDAAIDKVLADASAEITGILKREDLLAP